MLGLPHAIHAGSYNDPAHRPIYSVANGGGVPCALYHNSGGPVSYRGNGGSYPSSLTFNGTFPATYIQSASLQCAFSGTLPTEPTRLAENAPSRIVPENASL